MGEGEGGMIASPKHPSSEKRHWEKVVTKNIGTASQGSWLHRLEPTAQNKL